jgi:hypothetical protein
MENRKILFVSRHNMTDEQKKLLEEKFVRDVCSECWAYIWLDWDCSRWCGNTKRFTALPQIEQKEILFVDWTELDDLIGKYDEFIIVAPNDILKKIIEKWVKPLQFIMSFRGGQNWSPKLMGIKRIINIEEEIL